MNVIFVSIFGTALQEMPTTTITTTNTSCKYLQPCTMEILISREFVNSHFRFNFFLVCSHNSHHRVKRFSLVVLMTNYKLFRQYALLLLLLLTKMFAFFSFFTWIHCPLVPTFWHGTDHSRRQKELQSHIGQSHKWILQCYWQMDKLTQYREAMYQHKRYVSHSENVFFFRTFFFFKFCRLLHFHQISFLFDHV